MKTDTLKTLLYKVLIPILAILLLVFIIQLLFTNQKTNPVLIYTGLAVLILGVIIRLLRVKLKNEQ